ncbi:hypothetical protein [Streptomyces sp. YS415]|uniref:hypothetical protein n=1 Tax=Streptomyces sp. YS415 TaxID=2944806 RepID=UPI0020204585|nr:hypothetical protein [Streptomyces sp. YS415]MCL7425850.1 hypothetical protein [Streptomyces sp. YS415]
MAHETSSSTLPRPLRMTVSALGRVPGAATVGKAAEGALDVIGTVSPRGRRIAVYTGAGLLGVAGLVEWPVAVTGAAVAWLTQPRPQEQRAAPATTGRTVTAQAAPDRAARTVTAKAAPDRATTKKALAKKTPTDKSSTARRGRRTEN